MDPITLISTLGPIAANLAGGLIANKDIKKRAAIEEADARREVQRRRQTLPQYQIADSYNKFLQMSKQDRAADLEREAAMAREAGNVGALKAGGARALLGGLQGQSNQAAVQRADIEARSDERLRGAMQTYAGAEQDVIQRNYSDKRRLAEGELAEAKRSASEARKARLQAEQDQKLLMFDALGAGLGAAGSLGLGKKGGGGLDNLKQKITGTDVQTNLLDNLSGLSSQGGPAPMQRRSGATELPTNQGLMLGAGQSILGSLVNNRMSQGPVGDRMLDPFGTEVRSRPTAAPQPMSAMQSPYSPARQQEVLTQLMNNPAFTSFMYPNGVPAMFDPNIGPVVDDYMYNEDGGYVKKTKGEFSHEKNPIHMIQEGAKVGEMTGGESILNPKQTKKIEKLAMDGDSDLHKYVRTLFNKFKKK